MSNQIDSLGRFVRKHDLVWVTCGCKKNFQTTADRVAIGRGKYCSKSCMYMFRNSALKENHYKWKGDKVSYSGVHKWVAKDFGQPMQCEWCSFKTNNKYQIHWANISGEYKRDREDWVRLCAKCHYHYDRVEKYATA